MKEMRFDGRVAIVTGAGGNPGLGRAHARLLAARGAKVVVNDLGVGPDGRGIVRAHADAVVQEILDEGGEAVADTNSVAEEESARAVVQTALDAFGRVDILVNNAGVAILASFAEISPTDIQRVIGAHLMGNIWMCRAVWPHMQEQQYGRIVNITSGAMFGLRHVTIYGAAKGGIFGLTRGLAIEGADHGIKVNTLGPAAGTVATQHLNQESDWLKMMNDAFPAELVSPAVALLSHEECPLSGTYLEAGGGNVSARVFGMTQGYRDQALTIEAVRDHLDQILDKTDFTVLPDPCDAPDLSGALFIPKPYEPA